MQKKGKEKKREIHGLNETDVLLLLGTEQTYITST